MDQLLNQYKAALQHYATIPGEMGALARVTLDGPLTIMDSPYLIRYKTVMIYNRDYGDNRICNCGHEYIRHFDPYENYDPVGCKYCECRKFTCEDEATPWKLFLDDERDPVGDDWVVCRDIYEAMRECAERGMPYHIQFDHDLGTPHFDDNNGYNFAKWIVDQILDGRWKLPENFTWDVHSQNPVGSANINALLENFMKCQDK